MIEYYIYISAVIFTVILLGWFVGNYIAKDVIMFDLSRDSSRFKFFDVIEEKIFKFCNIDRYENMSAKEYSITLLGSNLIVALLCFLLIYFQTHIFIEGEQIEKPSIDLIFHLISAFITNTDQGHFIPEINLSTFSKSFTIPFLMFFSSASGLTVGIMFIRGITKGILGNFYRDLIRSLIRVLIPISLLLSIFFTLNLVPNTFEKSITFTNLFGIRESIILGPSAAFEAIKMFGQNGGGYFAANSSHPLSNPSYLTNFIQIIFMLLIPISLIFALGTILKNKKQSIIILCALFTVLIAESFTITKLEIAGNPAINSITQETSGNWSGKETRFGIVPSSIFSTSASNASGANNSEIESLTPIAVGLFFFNMSIEAIFGGQGLGTVYILNFILYTAFIIGLMVGKTPELFGKRIEKNEIILSSLILLVNPMASLFGTALALNVIPTPEATSYSQTLHHYIQVFYEFLSAAANNGSGLEGLSDSTLFMNNSLSIIMLIGWFSSIILMIYLSSSIANKQTLSHTSAVFRTDSFLFCFLLLFISISLTLIIIFPFIILGPIAEYIAIPK